MECRGCHSMEVIHLEWAFINPRDSPVVGFQMISTPFLSPDAKIRPSGDQLVHKT